MTILIENDGPVRTITLNRPAARNAIDIPLRIALAEAVAEADRDARVRAIILTGAGSTFCSGGDITTMQQTSKAAALERIQLAQQVIREIWATPKPVVAAVEGAAVGAGTALAAACDLVIAARDARFATTFLNVGLAGDMGVNASLPARIGVGRTRQMLMMAQPITAAEALDWGLVDAITEPGDALAQANSEAMRLAARPAEALATIKRMLAAATGMHPLEILDREADCQAALFGTDDFAEGVAAFQEKRPARFGVDAGVQL
jgi:2-(1,2-epoxy-1,2-dihydrophenyl)acetyl-CoA isomerase